MSRCVSFHLLLFVAMSSSFVMLADQAEAQMRRSPFGASRVSLGTLEPVREALKLTEEQQKLADELHDQLMEDIRGAFQDSAGDFEAARLEMEDLNAEATKEFTEKLDDTQKTRLTEIFVQANGPNALVDEAVMEALKITDDQKGELDDLRQENREAFMDSWEDFQGMSEDESREAFTKLQKEADDRLLGGLTEEQKASFEKLSGEEVEFDLSELRGGFGGGGGGGGRQGGAGGDNRPQRPE
jgi:hypothetical protein